MAQASAVLGKMADQVRYAEMGEQLKADFNRHFFDLENFTYGSQTADAMALDMGIVQEEYRKKVAGSIAKYVPQR